LITYKVTGGTTGANMNLSVLSSVFSATTDTAKRHSTSGISNITNAGTVFFPLSGISDVTTTEADAQYKVETSAVIKNLFINVQGNSKASTQTFKDRINGVDGTLTISVGSTATGFFEDTTHSDTIALGDLVSLAAVFGSNGSGISFQTAVDLVTTNTAFQFITGAASLSPTIAKVLTVFFPLAGDFDNATLTEANVQGKARIAFFASYLAIRCATNGVSATSTFTLRKNTTNTALAASITASTTGLFEDVTNTVSLVATDELDYQLVTGATGTNMTLSAMGMLGFSTTPSSIKTINGLAKASVKTVDGLAIASVKTWNGLA